MAYECKVYGKDGKLKKILRESQLAKSSNELFNQSSTKKISSFINRYKEHTVETKRETKFYNKTCVVCQKELFTRVPKEFVPDQEKKGKSRLKFPGLGIS